MSNASSATDFVPSFINWSKPTVLIVTGASRGLGRTIAIEFSRKLCEGSCVLLMARDKIKLLDTSNAIHNVTRVKAVPVPIDLSLPDSPSYEHLLTKNTEAVSGLTCEHFEQAILVHNAGTLGDVSKTAASITSATEVKDYMDLNLCSAVFLTSAFMKVFQPPKCRKIIVNISSLAAVQPFKGWSLYCTAKAARDMYFRVLAEEENAHVTVLNYAPGPLVTDMLPQILEQSLPEIRQQFLDAKSKNQLLTCEYSVSRLIAILESSKFRSGDHIDVYDRLL